MSAAPLTQVLSAVRSGSSTTAEITRRTGLSSDVVAAAVHHLIRLGRIEQAPAGSPTCPATGCGGCPSADDAVGQPCGLGTLGGPGRPAE